LPSGGLCFSGLPLSRPRYIPSGLLLSQILVGADPVLGGGEAGDWQQFVAGARRCITVASRFTNVSRCPVASVLLVVWWGGVVFPLALGPYLYMYLISL
jgi:hypothetical protein